MMKPNDPLSIWHRKTLLPALVLLVDSEDAGPWSGAAQDLVGELKKRLPEVTISSASAHVANDLQSALGAAAFLGAPSAIVVKLWLQDQKSTQEPPAAFGGVHLDGHHSDSPPDVEAIVASYQSALLTLAPEEMFSPCH